MNATEFGQHIKSAFEQEFPGLQTILNLETGILEVFERASWSQKPSVNVAEVYNMAKDRIPCEEAAKNILQAYHIRMEEEGQEQKEDAPHPGDIIFVAIDKPEDPAQMEHQVFIDKGDVILLFGSLGADGDFRPLANGDGADMDEVYGQAVKNLRRDFPCRCVTLCDYMKGHPNGTPVSSASGKDIYVLCCENDSFVYSSTGLYYSAKEIEGLSEQVGGELYVFRCTDGLTILCPTEAFTRAEAAELMERFSEERGERLSSEVLIYAGGRLQQMHERQHRAHARTT